MKQSNDDRLKWIVSVVDDSQAEAMTKTAVSLAAFYSGLADAGLPQEVCLTLTQAYIHALMQAVVTAREQE